MLQKFIPVANLPMVRGGARNLLDGSKCASIGHILGVYRSNMESRSGYAFEHCRDYVLANPGAAMQAAMLELVQSFNVGEMIDEVLKGVNLSSLIENDVAE